MNRLLQNGLIVLACALTAAASTAAASTAAVSTAAAAERTSAATVLPPVSQRFAAGSQSDEVPDFRRHIEPLFGRLGCNGRACHGSFQGRGGFHLSLFGYDAPADHKALLGSSDGRVDLKHPTESLILKKPTLTIDHEGGLRMKKRGGWEYRLLLKWIEGGAKLSSDERLPSNRLANSRPANSQSAVNYPPVTPPIRLGHPPRRPTPNSTSFISTSRPPKSCFTSAGETVQLHAVVHWTDGTAEDVTPICRYQSNDDALAKVDPSGLVTCLGKGDTQVVAFYDNGITPVPVFLPVSDLVGVEISRDADGTTGSTNWC